MTSNFEILKSVDPRELSLSEEASRSFAARAFQRAAAISETSSGVRSGEIKSLLKKAFIYEIHNGSPNLMGPAREVYFALRESFAWELYAA